MPTGWRDRPAAHLTRHFFDALFDFGFFSQEGADAFVRVLHRHLRGDLLARPAADADVHGRSTARSGRGRSSPYRSALAADTTLAIALPMWIVAFVTVLVSHSLFPDETDFRVLMPLPLTQAFVFGAKLLALALFGGLFIGASLVAVTPLVGLISSSRHAPHASAGRARGVLDRRRG